MKYQVTKTITHEQGFSTAFRQWRAESHCRFIHGYALSVEMVFEAETLDARNWVIDFGSFKPLREMLEQMFDHKTVIAHDDPQRHIFELLQDTGAVDLRIMDQVGCEAFAEWIAGMTNAWLYQSKPYNDVALVSVEVREHGANAARFYP